MPAVREPLTTPPSLSALLPPPPGPCHLFTSSVTLQDWVIKNSIWFFHKRNIRKPQMNSLANSLMSINSIYTSIIKRVIVITGAHGLHFLPSCHVPIRERSRFRTVTIPQDHLSKARKASRESNGLGFLCLFLPPQELRPRAGAQKHLWECDPAPPLPFSSLLLPRHPRHRPNDVRMEQRRCHLVWGPGHQRGTGSSERRALQGTASL